MGLWTLWTLVLTFTRDKGHMFFKQYTITMYIMDCRTLNVCPAYNLIE